MKHVDIYTDGACSGNPGPGGYGAILVFRGLEREISGGSPETTNNRMELMGAISALELLREPCNVLLTSDSKYLVDGINLVKGHAGHPYNERCDELAVAAIEKMRNKR